MPVRSCKGFSDPTAQILKTHNLLDHQPLVEFPMGEDFPKSILDGPHLLAPDWRLLLRCTTIARFLVLPRAF